MAKRMTENQMLKLELENWKIANRGLQARVTDYIKKNFDLNTDIKRLTEDNMKIGYRLDACLYSMVLMQNIIRKENERQQKQSSAPYGDTLSLAQ